MKINHISPFNFKGAVLNINSFSDNHGNLDKLDKWTIKKGIKMYC